MEYDEDNKPVRVDAVVVSTQHGAEAELEQIRKDMIELVINPIIPAATLPSLRTRVSCMASFWAREMGRGISSGVSSQA